MFTSYSLKSNKTDGTELRLYVDCLRQEVELSRWKGNVPADNGIQEPPFSEVDTPEKAALWIANA